MPKTAEAAGVPLKYPGFLQHICATRYEDGRTQVLVILVVTKVRRPDRY